MARCLRHYSLRSRRTLTTSAASGNNVSSSSPPLRMAVIGSGPAGFYTAYRVLSKLEDSRVDMYEALPAPYGLVRFGVAPDHPEVKNCIEKFDVVASSPRFTFIGNTPIDEKLPLTSLKPHYDAILLAYGASRDRKLGIPGEDDLHGVYSARAFVGWYNGLPEFRDMEPDLKSGEEAVIIGQGNVALDVARILLTDVDKLRKTDITEYALQALVESKVRRIKVVGRRGPMQVSFTIKELRELMTIPTVRFAMGPNVLLPEHIEQLPRAQKRLMQLLAKGNPTSFGPKEWGLEFHLAPRSFYGSNGRLEGVEFERTKLDQNNKAVSTGELHKIPASLAFRSIGYKSSQVPGMEELGIIFDQGKGVVQNDNGRAAPGVYASGWVKSGPTGVIASTMVDAFDTADRIIGDWKTGVEFLRQKSSEGGWEAVRAGTGKGKALHSISWPEWKKIEKHEEERGKEIGKEREKLSTVKEMLSVL